MAHDAPELAVVLPFTIRRTDIAVPKIGFDPDPALLEDRGDDSRLPVGMTPLGLVSLRAEWAAIPWFQIVQSIWVLGLRADYVNDWGSALLSDRLVNHILTFIKQTIARAGA